MTSCFSRYRDNVVTISTIHKKCLLQVFFRHYCLFKNIINRTTPYFTDDQTKVTISLLFIFKPQLNRECFLNNYIISPIGKLGKILSKSTFQTDIIQSLIRNSSCKIWIHLYHRGKEFITIPTAKKRFTQIID